MWHHQREGLDPRSTGIPFHHRVVTKEFLLERRQDIQGAERLSRDSQRAPDREAVGGLPGQAYTASMFPRGERNCDFLQQQS